MTPAERQQLRAMIDDLNAAAEEYRNGRDAFHDVAVAMHAAITALDAANDAQLRLIDKVIAANRLALALFSADATE